jgi:cyclase
MIIVALRAGLLALLFLGTVTVFAAEPIWDGNRVEMVAENLAPGVVAFYANDARELIVSGGAAATSSGLIVGGRGALLVDTMLNQRLNAQVLELARKATSLPLLYAVNTSAHGDHSYGNMYLPKATLVIQSAATRDYVAAHLDDDKAFMLKNFGAGRGIEPIVARTGDLLVPPGGKLLVDLGGRTVEIIDFGFAQTGGDLFVWDPQSRVMWTGNPVIASRPSLPWLLDGHLVETLETLRKVYAFLPPDSRIVPGHGVAVGREDLRWHLEYLGEVQKQVRAAVDQGLTLEQTVERVTMPDYRGYVLFDWVHPSLNVPAAYKDLRRP